MPTHKITSKNGYYALEAAIFLPVFIVCILTIGYLIRVIAIDENVIHIMSDEAQKTAYEAYYTPAAPIAESLSLQKRLEKENKSAQDFSTFTIYPYSQNGIDKLIKTNTSYYVHVKLPLGLFDRFERKQTLVYRSFTGVNKKTEVIRPEELAEEKESCTVWVFPRAGEKYHRENCTYIKVYPAQFTLSNALRRGYKPCSLCHPENCGNGTLIYCFKRSGKVYHTGSCSTVDKYVISMEKEEAEQQGYAACLKCKP